MIPRQKLQPTVCGLVSLAGAAAARKVAGIITVSDFTRQQLVRHYQLDPARITVVPNGIEGFAPAAHDEIDEMRRALGLERDYLLYVGLLNPRRT